MHRHLVAWVLLVSLLAPAGDVCARDRDRSQGPLEVISYIVYPVGFVIETVIFGPVRYLASFGPVRAIFGLKKPRPEGGGSVVVPPGVEGKEEEPGSDPEQEDRSANAL